jgi:hypothetical protein
MEIDKKRRKQKGLRDVEKEDGEDRIFPGANRLAKIPSVIFGYCK